MLSPPALSMLPILLYEPLGHHLPLPHLLRLRRYVFEFSTNGDDAQGVDNIAIGVTSLFSHTTQLYVTFLSLSVSLNVLLTFMIVARLVLQGWNARAATGSPAGISGLYKSIATMLVESSALFAVSSLLVIILTAINHPVGELFRPILAEIQVRAFAQLQPFDRWFHVITELVGHRFVAHHSTSRQQECIDGQHYCPWKSRPRGVDWQRRCSPWRASREVRGQIQNQC